MTKCHKIEMHVSSESHFLKHYLIISIDLFESNSFPRLPRNLASPVSHMTVHPVRVPVQRVG